jgi:hypothetical protein
MQLTDDLKLAAGGILLKLLGWRRCLAGLGAGNYRLVDWRLD